MSFPRYPEYKDSGVEWLGDVPANWDVAPLKREFSIVGGSTPKSDVDRFWDGEIVWVSPADLSKLDSVIINASQRMITEEGLASCGTTMVPRGSIVLSTRAPIGSLAIAGKDLCTNQGCKSLVPKGASSSFYAYLLSVCTEALNVRGKGTTFLELSGDELGSFRIPVPALGEQREIAKFLAVELGRIDELVGEQERLIALLKEKRQAVISHAVTKGLDPNVPMKDSGIEWLGEVPEHWTVMPIRYAARLESGHTPSRSHPEYWENCTVPWFTLADIWQFRNDVNEYATETKELISELGLANSAARLLPAGTVMLSRTASVGFSGIMGVPMATTQDFANWVCGERVSPEFLLYVFRAMKGEFRKLMYGSTHNTIYMPDIQMFRFACPPREEQQLIVDWIRGLNRRLDELLSEAEGAVGLLKERRSALISAAVTGKIDLASHGKSRS